MNARTLRASSERCRRARQRLAVEERHRDELIRQAIAEGWTIRRIADAVSISFGRVGQIAREKRDQS